MSKNYTEMVAPVASITPYVSVGTRCIPVNTEQSSLFKKKTSEHVSFNVKVVGANSDVIASDVSSLLNALFTGTTRSSIVNVYRDDVELILSAVYINTRMFDIDILDTEMKMKAKDES